MYWVGLNQSQNDVLLFESESQNVDALNPSKLHLLNTLGRRFFPYLSEKVCLQLEDLEKMLARIRFVQKLQLVKAFPVPQWATISHVSAPRGH